MSGSLSQALVRLPVLFALVAVPAAADTIFNNGFESGAVGAWSDAVGANCPLWPAVPDAEIGTTFGPDGDRVVNYQGDEEITMDNIDRSIRVEIYEFYGGPMAAP